MGAKLTRRAAFVMNFTEPILNCEAPSGWAMNYPSPGWFIENTVQVEVSKQISLTPVKTRLQNQFISNDKQCYNIQPTIYMKDSSNTLFSTLTEEEFVC